MCCQEFTFLQKGASRLATRCRPEWTVAPLVAVTNPGTLANCDGDSVLIPSLGTDSAGNQLFYSASGLPPGLSMNPLTGVIHGTVGSAGSYTVTLTATDCTDPGAYYASQTFDWTVSDSSSTTVTVDTVSPQANLDGIYD